MMLCCLSLSKSTVRITHMRTLISLLLLFLWTTPVVAQNGEHGSVSDSTEVVETIAEFQDALAARDSTTVDALLLPDAVILETGGFETKQEYFAHHFGADAQFLENVEREMDRRQVQIQDGTAWVSTSSHMEGTYRDESVERASAELMVLRRTPDGWRIAAIHWSSRSRE